ncbi:MAG: tRNA (adenosine(37)-N6)-threonylcarbamoyltransferase complex dimerization subunit type 1 TsaB [Roseburia sp.]|nr:tRNA (adenosine(37)-N6)-threonylcarbamoyltransferase complex dimerization subunit type 1 TsaB [Anaeroplasma bactoclasticum]MCM1195752.1 tRNA (adenosine(37)-N6)-threonylcarbamoyltransferase complex dimerization subunit type 1 TsaB [Roseburia sp.]MCM1556977.1 tRNA (adenosine(37)-N6)-threonylcarbamoyltransferase complex dimerization subunit type 1 TsaB [Anaeroplasma bactoclasticum]
MKTLIIDSATNVLYTALCFEEEVIYESYIPGKHDHASVILVEVEKACSKGNIDLIDIDRVIVGIGPGSYTGVRMGVAVGKMIATLESKIKLYEISTLKLMASGIDGIVLASIDARRGNCFGCILDTIKNTYSVPEALVEKASLEENKYDFQVNENEYKVNPLKVIKWAKEVVEPRTLVPNYLRETEAERNLHD